MEKWCSTCLEEARKNGAYRGETVVLTTWDRCESSLHSETKLGRAWAALSKVRVGDRKRDGNGQFRKVEVGNKL